MYQTVLLVACTLVAAMLAWNLYRSASYPSGRTHMSQGLHSYRYWIGRYQRRPYHAVSCRGECECLRAFREKRYLGEEAPPLPVPSCHKSHCDCKYVHFNDRRASASDRRELGGAHAQSGGSRGLDRRKSLGRRASDLGWHA